MQIEMREGTVEHFPGDVPRVEAGVVGGLDAAAAVHAVVEGSRAGGGCFAAPSDSSACVGALAVPENI